MAMLVVPDVFERTWGIQVPPFWPEAIASVRQAHPQFVFMAEVYWDMEWMLQQQGFDYTYDKRLYDRLRERHARPVREHFTADEHFQNKLARFLENHDEPRAAATFEPAPHIAAAVLTYLAPGLRFFHEGQLEGRKTRLSPHLVRRPEELVDAQVAPLYANLLALLRRPVVREGQWSLLECLPAWSDNPTADSFIAFCWEGAAHARLCVVVNYSAQPAQCFVRLQGAEFASRTIRFKDLLGRAIYDRCGDDLLGRGLFIDVPAWGCHVFEVQCLV
jgi:hypothetical protein